MSVSVNERISSEQTAQLDTQTDTTEERLTGEGPQKPDICTNLGGSALSICAGCPFASRCLILQSKSEQVQSVVTEARDKGDTNSKTVAPNNLVVGGEPIASKDSDKKEATVAPQDEELEEKQPTNKSYLELLLDDSQPSVWVQPSPLLPLQPTTSASLVEASKDQKLAETFTSVTTDDDTTPIDSMHEEIVADIPAASEEPSVDIPKKTPQTTLKETMLSEAPQRDMDQLQEKLIQPSIGDSRVDPITSVETQYEATTTTMALESDSVIVPEILDTTDGETVSKYGNDDDEAEEIEGIHESISTVNQLTAINIQKDTSLAEPDAKVLGESDILPNIIIIDESKSGILARDLHIHHDVSINNEDMSGGVQTVPVQSTIDTANQFSLESTSDLGIPPTVRNNDVIIADDVRLDEDGVETSVYKIPSIEYRQAAISLASSDSLPMEQESIKEDASLRSYIAITPPLTPSSEIPYMEASVLEPQDMNSLTTLSVDVPSEPQVENQPVVTHKCEEAEKNMPISLDVVEKNQTISLNCEVPKKDDTRVVEVAEATEESLLDGVESSNNGDLEVLSPELNVIDSYQVAFMDSPTPSSIDTNTSQDDLENLDEKEMDQDESITNNDTTADEQYFPPKQTIYQYIKTSWLRQLGYLALERTFL